MGGQNAMQTKHRRRDWGFCMCSQMKCVRAGGVRGAPVTRPLPQRGRIHVPENKDEDHNDQDH